MSRYDQYRILKYDFATATFGTQRTIPLLLGRHNAVPGMSMVKAHVCRLKLWSKSNLLFYSLYCAEVCYNWYDQSPPHCARATHRIQPVFDFTGPRFEPQTSHSRNEHVITSRPTGW